MTESDDHLIALLRSALVHMDDPPRLENHPLAARLPIDPWDIESSRGQALRRALRSAIAALDPGAAQKPGTVDSRSYQVLCGYALARRGMEGIAASLGISRRQAYRELRIAIEALAKVIRDMYPSLNETLAGELEEGGRPLELRQELGRLSQTGEQTIDLGRLMADVVENAKRFAHERDIVIQYREETPDLMVCTNRVMLRQALLNLLSHAVSSHQGRIIEVSLGQSGAQAQVEITYLVLPGQTSIQIQSKDPYAVAEQLLRTIGAEKIRECKTGGKIHIYVRFPLSQKRRLLIIDDNRGLINLFRSYLRHQPYIVYEAHDFHEALEMMDTAKPEIIILDVIMPQQDGWEVLEMLRAKETGRRVPIIVCSIINDPQLSMALGADAFLNKPVSRADLLQALDTVVSCST